MSAPLKIERGGKIIDRPRLWVIDVKKFTRSAATRAGEVREPGQEGVQSLTPVYSSICFFTRGCRDGDAARGLFCQWQALVGPSPRKRRQAPRGVKRKAFFSFHFDDVMRVNVVRNAWKITHPDSDAVRSFYDSSLWERRKLEGDDALKRLIREGVSYTSAVCVLIGSETWLRRWVKYEIARSIIDGRGLLAIHLNSIRHHQTQTPHTRGPNPLEFMAVGKVQATLLSEPRYYLFEKLAVPNGLGGYMWQWHRYSDFTDPVKLPRWLRDPQPDYVMPLSANADQYDYIAADGHKNIGAWIDRAAQRAGR
jgi:hypothetical protein